MTIHLNSNTFGIWQIDFAPVGNWLAHLARTDDPEKWQLDYRFRYFVDDKLDETSQDQKNWYTGILTGNEGKVLTCMREVFERLAAETRGEAWEILRGDYSEEEFFAEFVKMPGINARELTEEQYRERFGAAP